MDPNPSTSRLTVGASVGTYTIERLLGAGGMGEVYLARDSRLDRSVALKLLPFEMSADPERRTRFEREAKMAAALRHPHICTIFEVGESAGRPFIAMEYVEGTTLQDRGRVDLFSVNETLGIAIQIADALEEARQQHVVHRDLKSANIILTPRGDVKVLDFGLAKRIDEPGAHEASTAPAVTDAGLVIGTASYMSPEQALGQAVDHRSDLFSFGVVLYELLAGRLPFAGRTSMELFSAILHSAPPPIPRFNESVPDPFVRVVGKLLEKDREQRYQSAREVVTDLRKIRDEGVTASVASAARKRQSRSWARTGAAAVVLIAGGLGIWWSNARGAIPDSGPTSLVVLPAEVFGAPSVDWLGDAVPAWITTDLSQVDGLDAKVPPKTQDVHRVSDDAERVAQAYGVGRYVTSKMYADAKGISLTVSLVERGTRKMLWSDRYDGASDDYRTVVARAAAGLQTFLRPAVATAPAAVMDVSQREAAAAMGRGLYHSKLYNDTAESRQFDAAVSEFTRALALDDQLAAAAAEIGFLHIMRVESGDRDDTLPATADAWAQKALRIDPRSSRGWSVRSMAERYRASSDWRVSLEWSLKAMKYGPRDSVAQNTLGGLAGYSLAAGSQAEAVYLEPLYVHASANLADSLYTLNRSREALPHLEYALSLAPDLPYARANRATVLADLGRGADAASDLDRLRATTGFPALFVSTTEYQVAVTRGESAAAQAALRKVLAAVEDPTIPQEFLTGMLPNMLPFLARHGEPRSAAQLMDRAFARGSVPAYDWLVLDERLAPLRTTASFRRILAVSRERFVAILAVLEAAKARSELPDYLVQPLKDLRAKLKM